MSIYRNTEKKVFKLYKMAVIGKEKPIPLIVIDSFWKGNYNYFVDKTKKQIVMAKKTYVRTFRNLNKSYGEHKLNKNDAS